MTIAGASAPSSRRIATTDLAVSRLPQLVFGITDDLDQARELLMDMTDPFVCHADDAEYRKLVAEKLRETRHAPFLVMPRGWAESAVGRKKGLIELPADFLMRLE